MRHKWYREGMRSRGGTRVGWQKLKVSSLLNLSHIGQSLPLALRGPHPHVIPDQHDYLITAVHSKCGNINNIA